MDQEYDAEAIASTGNSESWDRLLIEEVPLLGENIENIINALDERNYTLASEQIDDIQSTNNWLNVKKELESRNQGELIISFNNSMSRLSNLTSTKNYGSIDQAEKLFNGFNKIEQTLGHPVIDVQRLLIVISMIGSFIAFGLYIIPKIRKRLNIKF